MAEKKITEVTSVSSLGDGDSFFVNSNNKLRQFNKEYVLSSIGGISKKLLWENASPSSAFAAQTVLIDLSAYDEIKIVYKHNSRDLSETVKVGNSTNLMAMGNISNTGAYPRLYSRISIVDAAGVDFEGCYCNQTNQTDTAGEQNGYCVPYQIYGIKGVQ